MKLSPAAEFAIRGTLVLASRYGDGPVRLDDICEERDLPKQYLAKIFASLAKVDLVTPVRGKHGGYMLSRDPNTITVLEVIEAVEGPIALNFCQHNPPKCEEYDCPLRAVWSDLQQTFIEKLGGTTLGECSEVQKARAEN